MWEMGGGEREAAEEQAGADEHRAGDAAGVERGGVGGAEVGADRPGHQRGAGEEAERGDGEEDRRSSRLLRVT